MVNPRTIEIVREETHGRRIVCACGHEDKAFTSTARAAAAAHNNTKHGMKYTIRSVDDTPLKPG